MKQHLASLGYKDEASMYECERSGYVESEASDGEEGDLCGGLPSEDDEAEVLAQASRRQEREKAKAAKKTKSTVRDKRAQTNEVQDTAAPRQDPGTSAQDPAGVRDWSSDEDEPILAAKARKQQASMAS